MLHFVPDTVLYAPAYKKKKKKKSPRESAIFLYYIVILTNASLRFTTQAAHTRGRAGVGQGASF